jgi:hypothetical protein
MAITSFIKIMGDDAAHAMGKSDTGRVFLIGRKKKPPGRPAREHRGKITRRRRLLTL